MSHQPRWAARSLAAGFLRSSETFPERPAIQLAGETLSYAALRARAERLAATLDATAPAPGPGLTAVFGHRSMTAFAGVLAALLRGHGYVPLNPAFPAQRTRDMLRRSGCRALIVDGHSVRQLDAVLQGHPEPLVVLAPDLEDASAIARAWPQHSVLGAGDLGAAGNWAPAPGAGDDLAYLLFTSGSTGNPKAVMVAHRNVVHFVQAMVDRYAVTETDRFSQTFDLTFDLSAFDMFVPWERGACLCVPTQGQKLLPARYITESALTVWFSVPSTAVLMNRLRMLAPGQYPGLRLSLFCGEGMPVDAVERWAQAAPNAIVENLYGPTELTIACTLYRWDAERGPADSEIGLVPIGEPYPGMQLIVADADLNEVEPGASGELLMTGPQLTLGYLADPDRTAAAFVTPPGRRETYYRTGDRVRRPLADAPLVYLGRMDSQIKIQGYRVELGEVESALREAAGTDAAVALGWPPTPSGADGIVAFVSGSVVAADDIRRRLADRLPGYMQPSEVRVVEALPLNANGKIDRKALLARLGGAA